MKALLSFIGRVRRPRRRAVANVAETFGFAAVTLGVLFLAGHGAALVVGGLLLVLIAYGVDRA